MLMVSRSATECGITGGNSSLGRARSSLSPGSTWLKAIGAKKVVEVGTLAGDRFRSQEQEPQQTVPLESLCRCRREGHPLRSST